MRIDNMSIIFIDVLIKIKLFKKILLTIKYKTKIH